MNRKQKIFLATALFIGLFFCIPVATGIEAPFSAAAGSYDEVTLYPGGIKDYNVTFSSNGLVDVFVTSTTADRDAYAGSGVVPATPTVLGNLSAISGSFCVSYPDPNDVYYLIIGNYNGGETATGTYELSFGSCGGIPGFEIFFVFFALLATFGILWSKKKIHF